MSTAPVELPSPGPPSRITGGIGSWPPRRSDPTPGLQIGYRPVLHPRRSRRRHGHRPSNRAHGLALRRIGPVRLITWNVAGRTGRSVEKAAALIEQAPDLASMCRTGGVQLPWTDTGYACGTRA